MRAASASYLVGDAHGFDDLGRGGAGEMVVEEALEEGAGFLISRAALDSPVPLESEGGFTGGVACALVHGMGADLKAGTREGIFLAPFGGVGKALEDTMGRLTGLEKGGESFPGPGLVGDDLVELKGAENGLEEIDGMGEDIFAEALFEPIGTMELDHERLDGPIL